eukprot:11195602-Lingulodinium_polyedra.AAC.1
MQLPKSIWQSRNKRLPRPARRRWKLHVACVRRSSSLVFRLRGPMPTTGGYRQYVQLRCQS